MESSIRLLAYLCSREVFIKLKIFLQAIHSLRSGVPFFSKEFFELHPELQQLRMKYSKAKLDEFEAELERSLVAGCLLLYPGHPLFPIQFLHLEEVPFLLRLKGSPVWQSLQGLSVVGHREPSSQSLGWMEQHLGEFLRSTPCFTVSGGARGVDQKTHILSLRTGRPTVAFLPSGLGRIYPTSLQQWIPDIIEAGGAVLSEYEYQRPMQKHFFAQRNRLISGLGKATLIVEARRYSGTLLTAQEALDQSRPLWVLPGHPLDPHCQGSLDLIFDGATLVRNAEDLSSLFIDEVHGLSDPTLPISNHLVENPERPH